MRVMKKWDASVKTRARELRLEGYSFGQLTQELGVAKSTLHSWIRGLKRPVKFTRLDRIRWAKEIQIALIRTEVQNEMAQLKITAELNKSVLCALYWAEGSKNRGMLNFANTDPRLMKLFITLLRQCYVLDERKFRVRLYLHWYHKERKVKLFWSSLLNIPLSQFNKTYWKKRSKEHVFRKNIGGICFLRYNSDHLREQVIHYSQAFGEKITGKIDVPVA
jgi:transposase-like protein